uniref:acyl-CoA-binding domain-containing protein 5-B isoform X3 n=1 Tax=Ciona intestinalis TaxID=7719 RepID=UPI00089DB7C4|nr:acyl-CoA-binding domain-containing protein 5-B isoform X3 [Ciona intestinalis]|eukprot:XP_018672703.1 acyl-CoA-binding domain-containing protein 5-B isoform X3 [Ciona intestinalis]
MADVESQFKAALEVIQNLPKDGPYKPSPNMMLLFYSYYKQATEGPCTKPKPWSFDVVNKAKWDSWNKLGKMGREVAMKNYVDELTKAMSNFPKLDEKQIIEVLPATDAASDFLQTLGNFYEVVDVRTAEAEKVKSLMKQRAKEELPNGNHLSNGDNDHCYITTNSIKNKQVTSDSEDEFCDTSPDVQDTLSHNSSSSEPSTLSHESYANQQFQESVPPHSNHGSPPFEPPTGQGVPPSGSGGGGGSYNGDSDNRIQERIASVLLQLQRDMNSVLTRLTTLETITVARQDTHHCNHCCIHGNNPQLSNPSWWPFPGLHPRVAVFILIWPFLARIIVASIRRKFQRR